MEERYFALLIDADNVSAKYITAHSDRAFQIWRDYLQAHLRGLDKHLAFCVEGGAADEFNHAGSAVQLHDRENATDSAMIIDAMDILYANDVNGFCIVSSDSDFTRLVSRLRESGKMVIGMGENKTPEPFRKACDKFTILENLLQEQNPGTTDEDLAHEGLSREKIEDEIIKIVLENQDSNKATGLGEVGSRLVSLYPDFDVRSYGYNMLSKFLEQFSRIQLVKHGHIINVALRENAGQKDVIDAYVLNLVRSAGKDGMELSMIGNKVYEKNKDFKIRDYGYAQFNKYVKSLDKICVTQEGAQMIARYVK